MNIKNKQQEIEALTDYVHEFAFQWGRLWNTKLSHDQKLNQISERISLPEEAIEKAFKRLEQTKKHSRLESLTNATIGLIVSYLAQLVIFPLLGLQVSQGQNVKITLLFFVISYIRNYALRRFFNQIR